MRKKAKNEEASENEEEAQNAKKLRTNKMRINIQEPSVVCHCGLPSRIMTAWMDTNPSRRFYDCASAGVNIFCCDLSVVL